MTALQRFSPKQCWHGNTPNLLQQIAIAWFLFVKQASNHDLNMWLAQEAKVDGGCSIDAENPCWKKFWIIFAEPDL